MQATYFHTWPFLFILINMKNLFSALQKIVNIIALILFISATILSVLGIYGFIRIFSYLTADSSKIMIVSIAVALLKSVDLFLISIVLFVFSLGIMILFNNKPDSILPVNLPEWLKVKNFMQLKTILWEAILTTILISFVTSVSEKRLDGHEISLEDMLIPVSIFLIALSLHLLKKEEKS